MDKYIPIIFLICILSLLGIYEFFPEQTQAYESGYNQCVQELGKKDIEIIFDNVK